MAPSELLLFIILDNIFIYLLYLRHKEILDLQGIAPLKYVEKVAGFVWTSDSYDEKIVSNSKMVAHSVENDVIPTNVILLKKSLIFILKALHLFKRAKVC